MRVIKITPMFHGAFLQNADLFHLPGDFLEIKATFHKFAIKWYYFEIFRLT